MKNEAIQRENPYNLANYFGNKIVRGNQHVIVSIYSKSGMGKSYLAAGLIIGVANYLAKKVGGKPQDYFNFNDNMACINRDGLEYIFAEPKKYAILWGDDIGVGMNARKFYDEFNQDMNDLLQTFRPNRNLVVITTQFPFLVDKVVRNIAHYNIDLKQRLFETWEDRQGNPIPLTTAKVSEPQFIQYLNRTNYPYLRDPQRNRFVYHINQKAPDDFIEKYEWIRSFEFKKLQQSKKEKREGDKEKPFRKKDLFPYVERLIEERGWTQKEACALFGMTTTYYQVNRPEKSTLADKIT